MYQTTPQPNIQLWREEWSVRENKNLSKYYMAPNEI